jgi:hypothetical protein
MEDGEPELILLPIVSICKLEWSCSRPKKPSYSLQNGDKQVFLAHFFPSPTKYYNGGKRSTSFLKLRGYLNLIGKVSR